VRKREREVGVDRLLCDDDAWILARSTDRLPSLFFFTSHAAVVVCDGAPKNPTQHTKKTTHTNNTTHKQVKEMLRVAYQCLLLSHCSCPPTTSTSTSKQAKGPSPPPPAAVATPPPPPYSNKNGGEEGVDLSFDAAVFAHPIIREHDYDGGGLLSSAASACALMTTIGGWVGIDGGRVGVGVYDGSGGAGGGCVCTV
jgi:hypothetical protein